ncbi:MAG: EAL domain-containing protein [Eubacteriales bacterium]
MKKIKLLFLCFVFLLCTQNTYAADSATLKVGYCDNYGVLKTPRINGLEGYGYEYLYKILEYTNGNYQLEFVECLLSDAMEMLENGEIDLFLPSPHSLELEETFLFSQESIGREIRFLSSTDPDYILTGDYRNLQNSNIAVQKGDGMIEELHNFLAENNLTAQVHPLEITSFHEVLRNEQYDYVMASSFLMLEDLTPAFILSSTPSYIMATETHQEILNDFDEAIQRIQTEEFMYQERTYLKYFHTDYNLNSHIFSADYEFMKFKSIYTVGVSDFNSAMAKIDENNEFIGIYRDILDQIAQDIGVNFQYQIIDENTEEQILNALDFSILPFDDEKRLSMKESDPLMQIPFLVIYNPNNTELPKVGTLSYYGLSEEEIEFFLPFASFIEYQSPADLQLAYESGEIDCMFLTSSDFNLMTLDFSSYFTVYLEYYLSPTLCYSDSFPKTKIEIINKFIARLNPSDLEYILASHTQPEEKPSTFAEILENNPIIINVFLGLLGVILFAVIWEEKSKKKVLLHLLNQDELTGFLTERSFLEQTVKILEKNPEKEYSIVSIDIDNFKYINEVYGYEAGTAVLLEFAEYLKDFNPRPLLSARPSSDIFLFFLETGTIAQQIQESMDYDSLVVPLCNKHLSGYYHFSLSMGMYEITNRELKVNYMVDCANGARSLGKGTMGNTFHQFTETMRYERDNSNEIISQTDNALTNHEFVMYYQPKIDLNSGKLTGTEALVRWIREGKVVPPNDFIPLFERNGFIEKLDYYVLDAVCQFITTHREKNLPRISVNLSGISAIREHLVENLMEVLERHNVTPKEIDIEITESAFVENFENAVSKLDFLRELGFTISMDDFGAGISSLGRLKEIPIDILKIDREFIIDSLENKKGAIIIHNVVRMAKDLKVETVAEGIETQEQLDFLKNLGCDVGQGYFFNRPLQENDFLEALAENQKNT